MKYPDHSRGLSARKIVLAMAVAASCLISGMAMAQTADVITVSKPQAGKPKIIIWSGDGGWHSDLDVKLGETFAGLGFEVTGLDTNVWFDKLRTREETAQKLSDMLRAETRNDPRQKIIVLGWSYGADVLPIAYNHLTAAEQKIISNLVLLSGGKLTQLQVTLAERTGLAPGHIPLEPELALIPRDKLICVYSDPEKDNSSCLSEAVKGAKVLEISGGHAFDHDAPMVVSRLMPLLHD
jgi:type IV secretory pathway VirJ component